MRPAHTEVPTAGPAGRVTVNSFGSRGSPSWPPEKYSRGPHRHTRGATAREQGHRSHADAPALTEYTRTALEDHERLSRKQKPNVGSGVRYDVRNTTSRSFAANAIRAVPPPLPIGPTGLTPDAPPRPVSLSLLSSHPNMNSLCSLPAHAGSSACPNLPKGWPVASHSPFVSIAYFCANSASHFLSDRFSASFSMVIACEWSAGREVGGSCGCLRTTFLMPRTNSTSEIWPSWFSSSSARSWSQKL